MKLILSIIPLITLAFVGFAVYFIFKQLEFVVRAINLYEKMITRQDTMISILNDIRGSKGTNNKETPIATEPNSDKYSEVCKELEDAEKGDKCKKCGKEFVEVDDMLAEFCYECGARK